MKALSSAERISAAQALLTLWHHFLQMKRLKVLCCDPPQCELSPAGILVHIAAHNLVCRTSLDTFLQIIRISWNLFMKVVHYCVCLFWGCFFALRSVHQYTLIDFKRCCSDLLFGCHKAERSYHFPAEQQQQQLDWWVQDAPEKLLSDTPDSSVLIIQPDNS